MTTLISFHTNLIAGNVVDTVSARELHTFLANGDMFANWFRDRVRQYGFVEGTDFVMIKSESNQSSLENTKELHGGRPATEYYITLDMAKELAMVERNERGKDARRYFIECEKKLLAGRILPVARDPDDITVHTKNFEGLVGALKAIGMDNATAAAGANAAVTKLSGVNILQLTGNAYLEDCEQARWFTPTQLGKMVEPELSGRKMNEALRDAGLQYKDGDDWVQTTLGKPLSYYMLVAVDGGRKMRQHLHWSKDAISVAGLVKK